MQEAELKKLEEQELQEMEEMKQQYIEKMKNYKESMFEQFLGYVLQNAKKDDPESVIKTIDLFCEKQWLMNVGPDKGKIVTDVIEECKPKVCVELGGFMGYSAILFGSKLPAGSKYYSIEIKPIYAAISTTLIEFAGISDKVKVLIGNAESQIPYIQKTLGIEKVDFLFFDHMGSQYLQDFKKFHDGGFLQKGSVVVADNCGYPGAPDYVEFLQNHEQYENNLLECKLEYKKALKDAILISKKIE